MNAQTIKKVIADYYKVSIDVFDKRTREYPIIKYRQIAHYFAYWNKIGTVRQIGMWIGMVDHSSVTHSLEVVSNLLETDKKYYQEICQLVSIFEKHEKIPTEVIPNGFDIAVSFYVSYGKTYQEKSNEFNEKYVVYKK